MSRQYTKVSGGSDNKRWEPNKLTTAIDPKNPPMLEGYYEKINELPGPNGVFTVHTIHTLNEDGSIGEAFDVSLGAVLDDVLGKTPIGSWVCVVYKGKKPSKTPGRSYNDLDLFVDNNAIPYNEMLKAVAGSTKSENTSQSTAEVPATSNNANAFHDTLPF